MFDGFIVINGAVIFHLFMTGVCSNLFFSAKKHVFKDLATKVA